MLAGSGEQGGAGDGGVARDRAGGRGACGAW